MDKVVPYLSWTNAAILSTKFVFVLIFETIYKICMKEDVGINLHVKGVIKVKDYI